MRRIGFTGDELHAFFSASPDDHVMLLFDTEGAPTPPTKHAMTDRFARGPGAC